MRFESPTLTSTDLYVDVITVSKIQLFIFRLSGEAMTTSFEDKNLQDLLEKIAKEEGFEDPKFDIVSATNPGENFVGQVFRVKIEDTKLKKCLSLIFKVSSPSKARRDMVSSTTLFRTESQMYEIILPTLNDFLRKHGVSSSSIFPGTARCYSTVIHNSVNETDVIVLEDKKVDGYIMGNMKIGMNADQCRLALQKVALLHSSYLALREREPETADRLCNVLKMNERDFKADPLILDFREGYLKGLDFLGEPYTKGNPVYEKLRKTYENLIEEFAELCKDFTDFGSITHGDFWTNNVLFKQNQDGATEDACLIDFQLSSVCSPINDISLFLIMCTTKEIRDQHYDDLIQFYYDEVRKTLVKCGCNPEKIIPRTKFLEYLQRNSKRGVLATIGCLAVLTADKSEVKGDIHSDDIKVGLFTDTAKIKNPETLRKLTERLNGVVQDADRLGYI